MEPIQNAERRRLADSEARRADWKQWGPYLSERAWGTVREDYSATGEAWDHFPHDHARSRAYRWSEDGLPYAGEPGVQLAWMEAKVGDWVVTPRIGKSVEINALWYNALRIMQYVGFRNAE